MHVKISTYSNLQLYVSDRDGNRDAYNIQCIFKKKILNTVKTHKITESWILLQGKPLYYSLIPAAKKLSGERIMIYNLSCCENDANVVCQRM